MAPLASAFVEGRIDTSRFGSDIRTGMASPTVNSSVDAAGKTTGSRYSSAFGNALKIGATLGAAFAVTKGVQFLKGSIDEAREASKVTALTASAIKATGNAANVTAGHVAALSQAISEKVGVDDEAIQSGANLLLTFKNISNEVGKGNDIFDQANVTITDMSAALGQDAKASAIQLGKALNDPIAGISALSRVGVTFTQDQKDQITAMVEAGDTMAAQKTILAELKSEFGGAGVAMADPFDKLQVAVGNVQEEVGAYLMPKLEDLANWFVKDGLPALDDFGAWFKKEGVPVLEDFADWATELGKEALPVFTDALETGRDIVADVAPMVKNLVGWFKDLPAPIRNTAVAAGLLSATGIAGGVARLATSVGTFATNARSAETRSLALKGAARSMAGPAGLGLIAVSLGESNDALSAIEEIGGLSALGFSMAGGPGAAVGAGIGVLHQLGKAIFGVGDDAKSSTPLVDDFKGSLDQLTGASTKATRALIAQGLEEKGLLTLAQDVGISGATLVNAIVGSDADWERATGQIGSRVEGLQAKIERLNTAFSEHPGRVSPTEHVEQVAAIQSQILALEDLDDQLSGNREGLEADAAAQRRTSAAILGTTITAKELRKAFEGIPKEVQTQIRELGTDITRRDVVDLAEQYKLLPREKDTLLKVLGKDKATRDTDDHQKNLKDTPDNIFTDFFVDISNAVRDTDKHHKNLDDVPDEHGTKFTADTDDARRKVSAYVQAVSQALSGIKDEPVQVTLQAQAQSIIDSITGLFGKGMATGGKIPGWSPSSSADNIPIRATADEWLIRQGSARKMERENPGALDHINRFGELPHGYALGGQVLTPQVSGSGVSAATRTVSTMFGRIADGISRALSKKINDLLKSYTPTHAGVLPGPNGHVLMDGEPLDAIHAAQIILAEHLSGTNYSVMQGSYQAPSSYSGTSHTGGGVADISPGNFTTQSWHRKVGLAAWGRNFPGAASAGSGAHVHEVSMIDPASQGNSQLASYYAGGDGLGGSDYGPRPPLIANLLPQVAAIRNNMFDGGGMWGINKSGRPEAVLDPEQSVAFRSGMEALVRLNRKSKGGHGGDPYGDPLDHGTIHQEELQDKLEDLKNALSKNTDQLHSTMQAEHAFASSVTAQFRDNELTGGGLSGFSLGIEAGTNDARKFLRLIKDLQRKGLDGPLLRFIMESGDLQLATELDQLNRKQIHRKENVYGEYLQTTGQVGQYAGHQQFGHEIKKLHQTINHLANQIHNLHDHIADGAAKGTERGVAKGMQDRGRHLHTRTAGRAG